jgi:hypothetical protein
VTVPNSVGRYDVGDLVRVVASFIGTDGITAVMPSQILLIVKNAQGSVASYQYGAGGASIQALASNVFAKDIDTGVNPGGKWSYRWAATGQGQAAEEWTFLVQDSFVL